MEIRVVFMTSELLVVMASELLMSCW